MNEEQHQRLKNCEAMLTVVLDLLGQFVAACTDDDADDPSPRPTAALDGTPLGAERDATQPL